MPATSNNNFGFDPSRNHYANGGNPGMSYTQDQLGVNARSIEDIILYLPRTVNISFRSLNYPILGPFMT